MKSILLVLLISIGIKAFSQQINVESSIYTPTFENINDNDYVKMLFKKSTLNTDSILKNAKKSKPFNPDKGDEILKKHEKIVPLNFHPEVTDYINIYNKGINLHLLNYLLNYYDLEIINELKRQQLPIELYVLPAILSGFNPNSTNKMGGEGYWHLYYPQAVKFGLTISPYVDERRDFSKSTVAAINYLKLLQNEYQDWELTLAAYICGPSIINNLMERKKIKTYWEIYPFLNPKIRDIVPAFTAYSYTHYLNSSNQIAINPVIETDTLYIQKKLAFQAIADVIAVNKKELQFYNPVIINEVFPKNYIALLPKNTCLKIRQLCDSIYYYQDSILYKPVVEKEEIEIVNDDKEEINHKVKSGDVLGSIAQKYGVKISQLQEWNHIKGTNIYIGQTLTIFKTKTTLKPTVKPKDKEDLSITKGEYIIYIVKDGDNLWDIAINYPDVTPDDIMELNNIDENLKIGQVLKIKKK